MSISAAAGIIGTREKARQYVGLSPSDPNENRLLEAQVQLTEEQLSQVQRQRELSEFLFGNAEALFQSAFNAEALNETGGFENLRTAADNAIRTGEADINRQTQEGLDRLRDTLAPERGLRPGDSPILGLGSGIVEAGQHQIGQLTRGIRGQEAGLRTELSQQAFQNRLALAGGVGQLGIGLSPGFDPTRALAVVQRPRLVQTNTRRQGRAFSVSSSLQGSGGFGGGG